MAPQATTPAIQITAAPTKKPTRKPTRKPSRKPTRKPTRAPHKSCVNGAYSTHSECDMFNICVNGVMVSQACAPGEAWNQAQTQCEPEGNVRCGAVKGPTRAPSKGRFPPRKPVSSPLQKAAAPLHAPCRAGEFSAYPGDCQQYQQCLWGKLEAFQCASGLHWNRERNICDWPSNANCNESPEVGVPDVDIPEILDNGSTESPAWSTTTTRRPWMDPTWPAWTPEPSTTVKTTTEKYVPSTLSGHYKIVCYFTNWAWYRRGLGKYVPEDIDANLCTHVVYGFAVLDSENLIIKAHDSWADFDNRFYERVTAYKRKGVKVSLALGGWNDSAGDKYSRLVNSAAARARFINHALGFLEKHNFDGLDLDWEYPKCWQTDCSKGPDSDKSAFSALVHELSVAFKPRGLLLSSAVSASKTVIDGGYDVPSLARDMDWIAVMAYDFHGQWDKKTGHVAPLYYHPKDDVSFFNANYSMHYWMAQGAPSRKLVMGMPLYGQSFTLGTSWDTPPELVAMKDERGLNVPARAGGQAGEYTRAAGFLAYYILLFP